MRFSVGYELTEQVRSAILEILTMPGPGIGSEWIGRTNGEVCEITDRWICPPGRRLQVDRAA